VDESAGACDRQRRELVGRLRDTTNDYQEKIAGCFQRQKMLADEKLRAVAGWRRARTPPSTSSVARRGASSRRWRPLRPPGTAAAPAAGAAARALAAAERLRLGAAEECLDSAQGSDDSANSGIADCFDEAWRDAQKVLNRAGPLMAEAPTAQPQAAPAAGPSPPATADAALGPSEDGPSSASSFFSQSLAKGEQRCIDCGLPDADWASVSYGLMLPLRGLRRAAPRARGAEPSCGAPPWTCGARSSSGGCSWVALRASTSSCRATRGCGTSRPRRRRWRHDTAPARPRTTGGSSTPGARARAWATWAPRPARRRGTWPGGRWTAGARAPRGAVRRRAPRPARTARPRWGRWRTEERARLEAVYRRHQPGARNAAGHPAAAAAAEQ
ncbi:unnamed protein product, partial [Prorocentrum cordatum]